MCVYFNYEHNATMLTSITHFEPHSKVKQGQHNVQCMDDENQSIQHGVRNDHKQDFHTTCNQRISYLHYAHAQDRKPIRKIDYHKDCDTCDVQSKTALRGFLV